MFGMTYGILDYKMQLLKNKAIRYRMFYLNSITLTFTNVQNKPGHIIAAIFQVVQIDFPLCLQNVKSAYKCIRMICICC
jgi:hypothetical protein